MTSEVLYVWAHLPGSADPVVAGRLEVTRTAAGPVGHFNYGQSYLSRSDAIPLDPLSLPLKKGVGTFTHLGGYPGVIMDAGPDLWGKRVIDRLKGPQAYPRGYLLLNDPGRSGCLSFSTRPDELPIPLTSRAFPLAELLAAAEAVETDRPVDPELLKALHPGTGGARPKCNVIEDGEVWIAKFPSADDRLISVPRLEHASMCLARLCGVDAAETRIRDVNGRDVCLVRRFDRYSENGRICRRGFLSARSVFFDDPAFAAVGTGSYPRLARWMPRFGAGIDDRRQLFRRLAFNVMVRNDDDHELNHGLVHVRNDEFALAKAYDIVPTLHANRTRQHALLLGDAAAGTVANLVSSAESFALTRDAALEIVRTIERQVLESWQEVFYEAGFGDEDLRKLEAVFRPIPEHGPEPGHVTG